MPGTQPILKNAPTKEECIRGAQNRDTMRKMGCGTDPDPANSFCRKLANDAYKKEVDHCKKFGR